MRLGDPQVAAEAARPGAAGAEDGPGPDHAALGNRRRDLSARHLQAAHGAVRQDRGAQPGRGAGDGGRRLGGFGASVAGSEQAAVERPRRAGHEPVQLAGRQNPRFDLILPRLFQPSLAGRQLGRRVGQMQDAPLMEPDVRLDFPFDAAPDAQALDDEGHLPGITALLAAIAPVAAGLLAGDAPLFAEGDGDPAPGQEVGRRAADDAAADDDHIGLRGDGVGGFDRIYLGRHGGPRSTIRM